jgi:predicted metal-dependent phosphoesterase TrpH
MSLYELLMYISPQIDGICVTDHFCATPVAKLQDTYPLCFFGAEITSDEGDILVYGVPEDGIIRGSAEFVLEQVHRLGGIAVAAHPFDKYRYGVGDSVYSLPFDAIEINGLASRKSNREAQIAAKALNLPVVGGSDAHHYENLNSVVTIFSSPIHSIEDLIAAVKQKSCSVRFLPQTNFI